MVGPCTVPNVVKEGSESGNEFEYSIKLSDSQNAKALEMWLQMRENT
jgi:hypothetical protein